MKYLCLIYVDESVIGSLPERERVATRADKRVLSGARGPWPGLLSAESLAPAAHAVSLRRRQGLLSITNGPTTPGSAQLDGMVLIEAANLDEAIRVAARIPAARFGGVEVRPVRTVH